MKNYLVKQPISLTEYPIFFLSQEKGRERNEFGEFIWKNIDGFIYRAGYKLPEAIDLVFLYYMLLCSQHDGYKQKMEFTRYEILEACGLDICQKYYDRLEDSLKRWKNVSIEFKGTFYDNQEYHTMLFGILDYAAIRKEDKKLVVHFSPQWLLAIKESHACKYIDFLYMKALKRPLSRRLFQFLSPKFYQRGNFAIGLTKLGQKLTLSGRKVETDDGVKYIIYASKVLEKIKPAIQEINKLSRNFKLMEEMGIREKEALLLNYEIEGKENDRVITFYKLPIEGYNPKKRRRRGKLPFQISPVSEEDLRRTPNQKYEEAIAWLKSLPDFNSDRLRDIINFPQEEVGLVYPHVRDKYSEGGKKKPGWIYRAFKGRWYLTKAKKEEESRLKTLEARKQRELEFACKRELFESYVKKHGKENLNIYGREIIRFGRERIYFAFQGGREERIEYDKLESPEKTFDFNRKKSSQN